MRAASTASTASTSAPSTSAPTLGARAAGARARVAVALGRPLRPNARRATLKPPPIDLEGGAPTACAEIDYERDVVAANVGARALGEALARLREPLVVRGGAKAWRASGRWTLETLVREYGDWRCDVRVIASPETNDGREFVYCEESHEAVREGKFAAPSATATMDFATAAAKVLRFHGDGAYVQSKISEKMTLECVGGVSDAFGALGEESQERRLWLALAGSVSPMHFDASTSTLVQVGEGTKRMLLYQPFALSAIDLYPNWHPLRRRGRRFAPKALVREAIIAPGDALIFPPRWAHYTESCGDRVSASVTQRFKHSRGMKYSDDIAGKFQRWANNRDRPNALARLVSSGLVESDVGTVLPRNARTGEVMPIDSSGWERSTNVEWRTAAIECATMIKEHIAERDLIGIYSRGSVANGTARKNISDVDLIVITRQRGLDEDFVRDDLQQRWLPRHAHMVKKCDVRFEYVASEAEIATSAWVDTFVIATQSVTIFGSPLPTSLPSSARIPKPRILESVQDDVDAAIRHGSERSLTWALKRLIRASYEKYALPVDGVEYTRDLYHCVRLALLHANIDVTSELTTALVLCVHSPRKVCGDVLWRALTEALCRRLVAALSCI